MTNLKYGYRAFVKHIGIYFIVILQLSVLLIAVNVAVGGFNSRDMLYKPFKELLKNDGYLISMADEGEGFPDYEALGLKGSYRTEYIYQTSVQSDFDAVAVHIIPDELYEKLCLPLFGGDYSKAVVSYNDSLNIGDTVYVGSTPVQISGMLTNNTYIMSFGSGSSDKDITEFYLPYRSDQASIEEIYYGEAKKQRMMIPYSAVKGEIESGNELITKENSALITFDKPLSKEEAEYNAAFLYDNAYSMYYVSFDDLRKNSEIYVNENLKKMLPIIICTGIIAVMGVLCCCAISVFQNLKNYAIYYINGATTKDCILINMFTNLIVQAVCAFILVCAVNIMYMRGIDNEIGFVMGTDNYVVSAAMMLSVFVFSQIISVSVLTRKTPKDILISKAE